MKKVAVVILNFKVKDFTLSCIESVKKSSYGSFQIIVVDNNSGDGIKNELEKDGEVIFIESKENLGYTGGNNLGIKRALELGFEYIFVLNPDTTISKEALRNLVEGLEKNGAAIVGPKIYFQSNKKIWFAGGVMDMANVLGSHRGVDEIDRGQYDQEMKTDYITGAAILIKREVFERIGLFDENYFLYYEDSDFCLRARKVGFKVMYIPSARVSHANAKSTGLGSSLQDYFITRNRLLFAKKFLPFKTQLALFREALRNLGNPVRRMAFFDFLIGNFGKGSYVK